MIEYVLANSTIAWLHGQHPSASLDFFAIKICYHTIDIWKDKVFSSMLGVPPNSWGFQLHIHMLDNENNFGELKLFELKNVSNETTSPITLHW